MACSTTGLGTGVLLAETMAGVGASSLPLPMSSFAGSLPPPSLPSLKPGVAALGALFPSSFPLPPFRTLGAALEESLAEGFGVLPPPPSSAGPFFEEPPETGTPLGAMGALLSLPAGVPLDGSSCCSPGVEVAEAPETESLAGVTLLLFDGTPALPPSSSSAPEVALGWALGAPLLALGANVKSVVRSRQ